MPTANGAILIYQDFGMHLIERARRTSTGTRPLRWLWTKPFLHSTPPPSICVCRFFRGPTFRNTKAAVKAHTLLDLRGVPSPAS